MGFVNQVRLVEEKSWNWNLRELGMIVVSAEEAWKKDSVGSR